MPLNTRTKKREAVEALAEYAVHSSTEKAITFNIPRSSVESETGEASFIKSSLIDISIIGCALDSPYLIPPGVVLDIKIDRSPFILEGQAAQKEPVRVIGKVKSCVMKAQGHYRLGVQFTKIEKNDADLIGNFIDQKDRRKAPRWKMTS